MKKNKGFTLIELLVVIAIIGILSTIVLVSLNTARQKARDSRRLGDIRQVALALEMYYDDHSDTGYPGDADEIGCNDWSTMKTALESGGYMTSVPSDPGTNTYYYEASADLQDYVLKAVLETDANQALNDDVDGTPYDCPCASDTTSSNNNYCIKP